MARRMKWGNLEDLQVKIDDYFETDKVPTIPGLCNYLDITTECWNYYLNERYKYKHKEHEKEEILKQIAEEGEDRAEIEALEDFVSINQYVEVIDNYNEMSKYDKSAEDTIKRQLSACFKKTKQKLEDLTVKHILVGKNSIGAIYLTKAVFGYREADSNKSNANHIPSKITIEIMPTPTAPKIGSSISIDIDEK